MSRSLIVLDLNGAILDAAKKMARDDQGNPLAFLAKTRTKYIYLRPGAHEFLEWLVEHFDVGIWTSCIERNAHDIVNAAIPGSIRSRFKFIYHRGQCELVPGPGYNSIKDLKRVWQAFPQYNASNTWAIDDTQSKYRHQPENLILLKEFKGGDYCDRELIRLQKVLSIKLPSIC